MLVLLSIFLLGAKEDVMSGNISSVSRHNLLSYFCLYGFCAPSRRLLASPRVFPSDDLYFCLNSVGYMRVGSCFCINNGPGGSESTGLKGSIAVEVCGWQLYAYVNFDV